MRHRVQDDHEFRRQLQRKQRLFAGRKLDRVERHLLDQLLELLGHIDRRTPEYLPKYSANGSSSGSCAAILRTRRLTVNVTSTISSSVGAYPAAHQAQWYSSRFTLFSVVFSSSTPPQLGHSTFHDSSKIPARAAWRKAAIERSSSRPRFAARSSTLMRQSARSGACSTNSSMAATVVGIGQTGAETAKGRFLRFAHRDTG